jgi:hypothetical protein
MGLVVNGRTEMTRTWIRSQASSCEIYGGQSGTGTVFAREWPFSSVSIISYNLYVYVCLTGGTNRRSLGNFQKAVLFLKSGTIR